MSIQGTSIHEEAKIPLVQEARGMSTWKVNYYALHVSISCLVTQSPGYFPSIFANCKWSKTGGDEGLGTTQPHHPHCTRSVLSKRYIVCDIVLWWWDSRQNTELNQPNSRLRITPASDLSNSADWKSNRRYSLQPALHAIWGSLQSELRIWMTAVDMEQTD